MRRRRGIGGGGGGGGEEEAVDAVAGDDVGERRRANVGVDDVSAFDQEIRR